MHIGMRIHMRSCAACTRQVLTISTHALGIHAAIICGWVVMIWCDLWFHLPLVGVCIDGRFGG